MFDGWLSKELRTAYLQSIHKERIDRAGNHLLRLRYVPVVVRQHLGEWVRFVRFFAERTLPLPTSFHDAEV